VKKAKDKKKQNINPAVATNENGLATTTNALDLIQKAKELDAKKQANAPAGVRLSQNWLTRLDSDAKTKEMYLKEFIDNKVTSEEYNAVLKYFSSFEKSESETIKKLSQKEQELLRSFDSKLPFRKKLP
jgi:4-alpha-glucanotransferase